MPRRRLARSFASTLVLSCAPGMAEDPGPAINAPSLVVVIVVEQLPERVLERLAPRSARAAFAVSWREERGASTRTTRRRQPWRASATRCLRRTPCRRRAAFPQTTGTTAPPTASSTASRIERTRGAARGAPRGAAGVSSARCAPESAQGVTHRFRLQDEAAPQSTHARASRVIRTLTTEGDP